MKTTKKRLVACPNCKKLSEFSPSNAFRPFCSERCKLIDLGVWANEGYAIPEAIKPEDLADLDNELFGH
ncbi:MAG: DNA gyrase inhibitor YacG [Methylotenera sp.]|nr:DNA gyrase inhibitor YacG [Methylotenera sp.]MDZ4141073.1 DNA gyrase inhibitor YacG [Methylotenera sp.]